MFRTTKPLAMYLVLTIHMQFTYPVATQVPYLLTYLHNNHHHLHSQLCNGCHPSNLQLIVKNIRICKIKEEIDTTRNGKLSNHIALLQSTNLFHNHKIGLKTIKSEFQQDLHVCDTCARLNKL